DGAAADADDRDVADLLELDHVVGRVAAAGDLAGVAVVDGAGHLDDDRRVVVGPAAQGLVDLGARAGLHRLAARTAGGAAVLARVAGGDVGRRGRVGHRQDDTGRDYRRSGHRRPDSKCDRSSHRFRLLEGYT